MLPKAIAKIQTNDRTINQLQQNIIPVVNQINKNPIVTGTILQSQSLKSGSNTINHNLGRTLQGWVPVRVRSQATLWDSQDGNATPQKTLILNTTADVVVDIMVF